VDPVDIALFGIVALALGYVVVRRIGLPMDGLFAGIGKGGSGGVGETATRFVPIANVAALGPLFFTSRAKQVTRSLAWSVERDSGVKTCRTYGHVLRPTALFLHDPGCPISRAAYRQMARLGDEIPLVDVRRAHGLSRVVEERSGVRHESPQVIVLRQGRAVWSASHYAITTQAVTDALHQAHGEAS